MKFLLFSDLHHLPWYFMKGSLDDLRCIQQRAADENVDFIIHAGDLCHGPGNAPELVRMYNDFHIPSYHCLGNHDADDTPFEETLAIYGMPGDYYFFDNGGYRIIVMNPNYLCVDGKYYNYSLRNYNDHPQCKDHVPPQQLEWLEETLASSPFPCIIISHQSFEREADGVKNQLDVRRIINAANASRPHSVLMCINGHNHRDYARILDGVCYFEINSASYDWVVNAHNHFPEDICQKHRGSPHTLMFNDPLSAIITIEGTTIDIKGMESSFFMGVTRDMTDNPVCDNSGRPSTARVQSLRITLG